MCALVSVEGAIASCQEGCSTIANMHAGPCREARKRDPTRVRQGGDGMGMIHGPKLLSSSRKRKSSGSRGTRNWSKTKRTDEALIKEEEVKEALRKYLDGDQGKPEEERQQLVREKGQLQQ